ncbi:MAG: hypothetical protein V7678_11690 [Brevundimonas sp.]
MVHPDDPKNPDADQIEQEAEDLEADADALQRRTNTDEPDTDDEGVGDVGGLVP